MGTEIVLPILLVIIMWPLTWILLSKTKKIWIPYIISPIATLLIMYGFRYLVSTQENIGWMWLNYDLVIFIFILTIIGHLIYYIPYIVETLPIYLMTKKTSQ